MNIVIVSERVHPFLGGTERRWDELAKHLALKGHSVSFITGRGDITKKRPSSNDFMRFEEINGYKIYRVCDYGRNIVRAGTRSIQNMLKFGLTSARFIQKLTKKIDIDVIDVNVFPHLHLPIFGMKIHPTFVTWHEVWLEEWKHRNHFEKMGKPIEYLNARIGANQIAVSKFTRDRLLKISGLEGNKIHLVTNGVSDQFFIKTERSSDSPVVLFVGRLTEDKNVLSVLIPQFLKILKEYPYSKLIIIGDGELRSKIQETVSKYTNIEFYHGLSGRSLVEFYKASNVFALPSSREGSGIAAMEALVSGIPVVTVGYQNNGVAYDLIVNDENGYVCHPSTFHKGIIKAFENRHRLTKNFHKHRETFRWKEKANELEKYYKFAAK